MTELPFPCTECAAGSDTFHGCHDGYVDYDAYIGGVVATRTLDDLAVSLDLDRLRQEATDEFLAAIDTYRRALRHLDELRTILVST